jgi:hypothetical protein
MMVKEQNMAGISEMKIWIRSDPDEVEKFAGLELHRYLSQIFDRPFDLVSLQSCVSNSPFIYLSVDGRNTPPYLSRDVEDLPCDGYFCRGTRDGAVLQAKTSRGLLYAVYGLLKFLGARWFFPGPEGEVIPHLKTLDLAGLDLADKPAIDQRGVLIRGKDRYLKEWIDFAPKIGLNAYALETHYGIHDLPELARGRGLHLRLRRHFFPTIFCSQDRFHLLWEETLVKGYLQSLPAEIDSIHIRPADAQGKRCTCSVDKQYSLADQVMRFTNRMAEVARQVRPGMEYPYVAYQSTWCPPPQVKPGPGVILSLAPIHRCFNHAITASECPINSPYQFQDPIDHTNYGVRPICEAHMQVFDPDTTFVVDYWVDASYFGRGRQRYWERRLPNIGGILQKDIQYYHSLGISSIWTFVVFVDDAYLERFTSPLIFQYGDLLWNPDADLRAGLRDFCKVYFGNETLADVFPLAEPSDPKDTTPEVWEEQIARLARLLPLIRELANDEKNPVYKKRISRLADEQVFCLGVMQKYMAME